jgi:hypothetical protein
MSDKSKLEQMLESLVNDDQAKAEELFHEYVVAKSREIYENLIDAELDEEMDDEEENPKDKKVDEEMDDEEENPKDKKVDEEMDEEFEEGFEDIAIEGDDEMGNTPDMGDDLEGELSGEEGEMGEKAPEELFQDLDAIVDELQAKFDAMGGDMGAEDEMGGDGEMPSKEGFGDSMETELATVREYVEKVAGGHGAEKKGGAEGTFSGTGGSAGPANTKSSVAGKNDMGGTASNIAQSKEEAVTLANQGHLKGSSLFKGNPKEDNAGNINVPGGKAGGAFSKKEPGHGAEKKGEAEGKFSGAGGSSGSVDKASLFRGRR